MKSKLLLEVYCNGQSVIQYPLKYGLNTLGSDLFKVDYPLPFPEIPPLALILLWQPEGYFKATIIKNNDNPQEIVPNCRPGDKLVLSAAITVKIMAAAIYDPPTVRLDHSETALPLCGKLTYGETEIVIGEALAVGKNPNNDLIVDDEYLSDNHFQIIRHHNHYILKDLASTNGTLVDGHLVHEAELPGSCTILAGKSYFHFYTASAALSNLASWHGMIGQSSAILNLQAQLVKAAQSSLPVLIHGETGSGKELVARALFELAFPRQDVPYIVRNCGTFTENLLCSELFGHKKGAFTGAIDNQDGAFAAANGGMLFLDELGELPLNMQPALLRAVEYGEITPIGSNKPLKIQTRFVGASHRYLPDLVKKGLFREDLYYRLAAFPLEVPPLRDRGGDIILLARYFMNKYGAEKRTLATRAQEKLLNYRWPGNIRELANCIQFSLCHSGSTILTADDIILPDNGVADKNIIRQPQVNRTAVVEALKRAHGQKRKAADNLQIGRTTLYRLINMYGICRDEFI